MNQSTYFNLNSMRDVDIHSVDPDKLMDIRDTKVDIDKPLPDRVLDYLLQIHNPYCFLCGNILVKIEYSKTETTIEDCMEGFFRSLC